MKVLERGGKCMSKQYETSSVNTLGEINITTTVLETIAAQAASKAEGVYVVDQSYQKISGGFFSFEREKVGARVTRNENTIAIDIDIRVKYGYSVPDVAMNVQDRVKEQILFMTDLIIDEVNVHVLSIETGSGETELFHLEDENGDAFGE